MNKYNEVNRILVLESENKKESKLVEIFHKLSTINPVSKPKYLSVALHMAFTYFVYTVGVGFILGMIGWLTGIKLYDLGEMKSFATGIEGPGGKPIDFEFYPATPNAAGSIANKAMIAISVFLTSKTFSAKWEKINETVIAKRINRFGFKHTLVALIYSYNKKFKLTNMSKSDTETKAKFIYHNILPLILKDLETLKRYTTGSDKQDIESEITRIKKRKVYLKQLF